MKALQNFKGVDNYSLDGSWRIDGKFIRSPEGTVIEIVNVLGQAIESIVFGAFKLEIGGQPAWPGRCGC